MRIMIKRRNLSGVVVYDIDTFDEEADLSTICNILANTYSINISEKFEGPGTTIWKIVVAGHPFSLINNTWGCFLKPESNDSADFMEVQIETLQSLFF